MGRINQLSFEVANLIAAGEVVDRPSSVIKELVENSIDSGATRITVEIQHGGVLYMRVTDNGSGILPEDLPIAVRRHATSKIKDATDLEAIMTLGFRGEALAAISSVSDMRIISKVPDAAMGASIEVNSGRVGRVTEQGAQDGTTVIVENLFANVPARLKFLKRDITEAAAVIGVAEKIAMSHPEIAFRVISDGNMKLDSPGDGRLISAVRAVYGKDIAISLLPVDCTVGGVRAYGYISSPSAPRANRNYQNFFINRRYVKTRTGSAALEQAYTSYIPPEKFPGCVINLELSPASVDVNVHPSKLEVKFSNERPVFECIYHAVRDALTTNTLKPGTPDDAAVRERTPEKSAAPAAGAESHAAAENTAAFTNEAAEKPKASYNASVSDYSALRPASGTAPAYPQRTGNQSGVHAETDSAPFGLPRQAVKPMVSRAFLPIKDGTEEEKPHSQLSIADLYRTAAPDAESPETAAPSHIPEDKPAEHAEAAADGPTVPFRNYRIAGELFNAYILVTEDDRVTVIDKHAAHERLNFERMKARLHGAERTGMLLMLPIVPQLGTAEMDALMSVIDDVEKIGFGITEGDRGSLEITEIPSELDTAEAKAVIERIAGAVLDGTGSPELIGDTAFEKALYQASCKASIKAGRVYPEGYNEALVAQLMAHPEITYCPHGRPVAFVMTKSEFDRRFLRI